jgi:hypothetical protein
VKSSATTLLRKHSTVSPWLPELTLMSFSCTGVVLNNNYCYSKNNVYLKQNFNKNSASVLALKGTCAGQYATGTVPDEMNKACCWS